MQQPICYSKKIELDWDKMCSVCQCDDNYRMECYCDGIKICKKALLCKVSTLITPARDLKITTIFKYEISGKTELETDSKSDEIIYDQYHNYPPTFTIILEGSDVEDDYRQILKDIIRDFIEIHWDFKGKYPKSRYISFATQRIDQVFIKKNDIAMDNNL